MGYGASSPTISAAGINAILNALKQMGLNLETIKREARLDRVDLNDCELRLNCHYASDCYQVGQKYWGDDDFGLEHGQKYQPFTLGIVGHLLSTAQTGLEALYSYEQYQTAFGEGLKLSIVEESRPDLSTENLLSASLWVHPEMQSKVDDNLVDSFFVAFVNCLRLLTSESSPLLGLELRRKPSPSFEKYDRFFACPIEYSMANDRVLLSKGALDKPLLSANPMLFEVLKKQSESIINGLEETSDFAQKVRSEILKCIDGSKIGIDRVAARLAMSDRTLQRKLHKEGVKFQSLLEEVRAEFSKQHLKQNLLSIEDLSYLLAYSEPSIFRKTFKLWTGLTPSSYRQK